MLCLAVALLFGCVTNIHACPDPLTMVHIQNYDGPIIVHSANCDSQQCTPSNQYYSPCNQYGSSGNQYCSPSCQYGSPSNQYCPGNQYCPSNQCETDCTCVTKHNYYPCNTQSSSYPATNYGCGTQYCKVDDVKVYPVVDGYSGYGNRYGNKNCQCQCVACY